ncbi:MAG: glutathione S-transferase family protein [Oligoflexales bacterium]
MIKLYDNPTNSNSRKIHAIARDCDVTLEIVPVDLMKGEGQKPDFLAINPNGKIPAMVDGKVKLFESNAILCYIAAKHNSPLLPQDAEGRAQVDQWLFWQSAHLSIATGKITWERVYKGLLNRGTPDQARIEEGLTDLNRFVGVLDGVLAQSKYICGSKLTVADYAICATLAKTPRERSQIAEDVLKYPNVKRWLSEVESLPAWMHAN